MKISERKLRLQYIAGDFIMSNLAWLFLNAYRYTQLDVPFWSDMWGFLTSKWELQLQLLIPLFWMIIHYYSGYYNTPMHRDRLKEFGQTFYSSLVGTLVVFFLAIINDVSITYHIFYKLLLVSFLLQFVLTYLFRCTLTHRVLLLIKKRKLGWPTLIIGAGRRAADFAKELDGLPVASGNLIQGFIDTGNEPCCVSSDQILGQWKDIPDIIRRYQIMEIVVAPDSHDEKQLFQMLKGLYMYNLPIKAIAGKYSVLSRAVKMRAVYSSPMIEITRDNMSESQKNIKQTIDCVTSLFFLVLLSPLFLYLAWRIRRDSPGNVFYRQERIGYRGRPFHIIKFRTMRMDAEQEGVPRLSSETDSRITPFGRLMRKYRLDELPQFINILKGEMSLVGPRPERKYFVDQIIKEAPYYCLIYNVKPGLTSWATVRNGYANTLEKMLDRLKYDIIYLESRSLGTDFKILFYTIKTVFTGEGM